jgi:hypothetical protein
MVASKSLKNVAKFKYLGTNQNCIDKEMKSSLNLGNTCYHSVHDLLSSSLSKNLKIKMYKTITLPVVLYGYGILSVSEKH